MSTTDKRVEELLDRWLASVDLHLRYLKLDDAAYARAESWPKHQRPNALVVNLARTRLLDLKRHLKIPENEIVFLETHHTPLPIAES